MLDHRLDHDVDIAEIAIVEGRANGRQNAAGLFRGQLPALHLLGEQLVGLAHAQCQRLVGDVFHDDGRAFRRALKCDASAHDAGAEHRRLLNVGSALHLRLRGFLEELVVEEQPYQRIGHRGLGQLGKRCRFNFERVVAALAGGFLDGLDGSHGRRIVLARLARNETFRGVEHHCLLDHVELERRFFLCTTRLPIVLAFVGLPDQRQGGVSELFRLDHRIHRPHRQCGLGLVLTGAGHPLDGVVGANQARQTHGAAKAGNDAQLGFGQADHGRFAHHPVIGGQRHFKAPAQRNPVDCGDAGTRQVFKSVEDLVGLTGPAGDVFFTAFEHLAELGDVGPDDENALGRRDDQSLELRRRNQGVGCRTQFAQGQLVELVDTFTLPVEAKFGDTALVHRQP